MAALASSAATVSGEIARFGCAFSGFAGLALAGGGWASCSGFPLSCLLFLLDLDLLRDRARVLVDPPAFGSEVFKALSEGGLEKALWCRHGGAVLSAASGSATS